MKNLSKSLELKKDAISVVDLNKQFKSGYGIKDINFLVKKGAVFGYLGPNGAGKSTTIRALMGFLKPNSGVSNILDSRMNVNNIEEIISYDSWTDSNKIQKIIGYVPGEIAFPENMTGIELLKMVFKLRNMTNWDDVKKQIYYWEFDPSLKIKKMSKGMKQKLALCIAWMHNPDIIILDEPTTGLDPLMQEKFVSLIKQSKKEGKAIILSSHIFSEIEKTCDYVSIIKRGEIISTINIEEIQYNDEKTYEIKFVGKISDSILKSKKWNIISNKNNVVFLTTHNNDVNDLLKEISKHNVEFFKEHPLDLEQYFMKYYQNDIKKDAVNNIEKQSEKINHSSGKTSKGNSKALFEMNKRSITSMFPMWAFLTGIALILIISIIVTMQVAGGFVPPPVEPGQPETPPDVYVNTMVQSIIGDMLFGTMGYILLVVFIIMNASKIVSLEVERGTMVNLLTTSLTRQSVILSKMLSFIGLIAASMFVQYAATLIVLQAVGQIQNVDLGLLTIKALGGFLLLFFIGGFSFLFSTHFNRSTYALGLSGAIVIISLVFQTASSVGLESLEWMKYLSINSLFVPTDITSVSDTGTYLGQFLFLGLGGIGIFTGSYLIFTKKDLPL